MYYNFRLGRSLGETFVTASPRPNRPRIAGPTLCQNYYETVCASYLLNQESIMSPFRAERDTADDFYFSADILDALTELDKAFLAPPLATTCSSPASRL